METIKFKGDSATRRRFFTPASFAHPAKMASGLVLECIERYTKPGDWVLDCMAGSGTLLLGAMYGRNLILNELELHFLTPMIASWAKIQQNGPALGYTTMGKVCILRGDARCLPLLSAATRHIFEGDHPVWVYCRICGIAGRRGESHEDLDPCLGVREPENMYKEQSWKPATVSVTEPANISRGVDVVLTSPPREDKTALPNSQWLYDHEAELAERFRLSHAGEKGLPGNTKAANRTTMPGYTRPQPPVNAIVTSPSYENAIHPTTISETDWADPKRVGVSPNSQARLLDGYARNSENVGNLRGDAYWQSMKTIYAECWRVLRPGGIMALVLKGFTRDGAYVDLPGQTEALLLEAGWVKHDHWRRELWSLSFWRILQKRRDPAAFDNRLMFEEILAFRKPEGAGMGVDTVITSPPYEGTAVSDLNASPLNGPIGNASRQKDRRKGGNEEFDKFGAGYTRPAEEP